MSMSDDEIMETLADDQMKYGEPAESPESTATIHEEQI
jgi:hypothetical protein